MRKFFLTAGYILCCKMAVWAQAQMSKIELQKLNRQAVELAVPYPQDITEEAVRAKMEETGNKGKEDKGFMGLGKGGFLIYKGVTFSDLGGTPLDLYFKAEQKSHNDKESFLYLVIGKGANNFASDATDKDLMEKARKFMDRLLPFIESYSLDAQISDQEKTVKKTEDRISSLTQDSLSLDKRIKALQDKAKENSLERQHQAEELEKQRDMLEALKMKRRGK